MQNLAVWKTRALKWKIFLHFFMSVLPFSVKLHMHVSTMGAIFTSCILHNSREWLSTLPLKRIPLAPLLAIPSCWFVCSIVQPAEWYIVASLPVVAEVESSIIPVTGTEDLMDWEYIMKLWGRWSFLQKQLFYVPVLYTVLPFLFGIMKEEKSQDQFLSFVFMLKEVNTINKNALNKPKIDWSFSCLFWISDVIFSWTAVNAM